MNKTEIEWSDMTWNPVRGCSLVSAGCESCYAMKQAHRFSGKGHPYEGLTELGPHGPRWTGKIRLVPEALDQPLKIKKPQRIFVNSMSDLFHEDVPDEFIQAVFTTMACCPQHVFQILTKRPQRMAKLIQYWKEVGLTYKSGIGSTLSNVLLGVSVEDQKTADERIPLLLQTPAAVRWISAEPLLGPVSVGAFLPSGVCPDCDHWNSLHSPSSRIVGCEFYSEDADGSTLCGCRKLRREIELGEKGVDWVVVGGESGGPKARPMHPAWARWIRDQCQAAGVPFFFKQWGAWAPLTRTDGIHDVPFGRFDTESRFGFIKAGKKTSGSLLDGREWKEFPA